MWVGTTALIVRLAKENPSCGSQRMRGELATMGIAIARSGPTWAEFLTAQAQGLLACDFFSVDTVLLCRLSVLVFVHHDMRLVRIAGVRTKPVTDGAIQHAWNISMELAAQVAVVKFLICDRDTKFSASFDAVVAAEGMRIIKTPPLRAPRANAIAERVVGTIGRECLDRMLVLGRRRLEAMLREYVEHYNQHRSHRSSSSAHRPGRARLLPSSVTSTSPSYDEPTVWVDSSTSTGSPLELGGWISAPTCRTATSPA